ncbi:MAG: signal peptidase II [Defluviitaleaceae bacterium]|nr:signal peptidase II [Defluviitaleaceae bacterium]
MLDKNNGNSKNSFISWAVFCMGAGTLIFLDQLLKLWSTENLADSPPRALLNDILGLTYFHNTGAAFGFLADFSWGRWAITALVIVLLATVMWYYWRLPLFNKMWFARVPLIFIFAGGIGNLIDRFRLGYVVDMLEFLFIDFAIFNLADVYVTVGAFTVVAAIILLGKDAPWPFNDGK